MKNQLTDFQLTLHVVFILLGFSLALGSFSVISTVVYNYFENIERYSFAKEMAIVCALGALMVVGIYRVVKSARVFITS